MPRRLHNWNYRQVTDFLRENGFRFLKELGGSHQAWSKRGEHGEVDVVVEVNFTHTAYPPKALKRFIRQSRIDADEWISWGGS
jgi:hypothetical protein